MSTHDALRSTCLAALCLLAACNAPQPGPAGSGEHAPFRPLEPERATLWDRQTTETADLLEAIVADFNATHDGLPVEAVQSGGYGDIYRKVTSSIQAGALPSMAVAYESMTTEYVRAGAVVALDEMIDRPDFGLSREDLEDFFPAMIQTNTFDDLGGVMYSFPYTKSVLMLYSNLRVLRAAGFDAPPRTWDEFLAQCRAVKEKTGKFAIAISVDASTMDGIIYSMGGDVYRDGESLFDSDESIAAFKIIETLGKEKLGYQIPPRTFNDEMAFSQDEVAFTMRTSAGRPYMAELFDEPGDWAMSVLPQADPDNPRTVLFGANLSIFATDTPHVETAWEFISYFCSPETTVRWALGTGCLPVRESALEDPQLQTFWEEWPYNRAAFDALPFAYPEPNAMGWQQVRDAIEKAETAVLTGLQSAEDAARELDVTADRILQGARNRP